jgi:FdhD protein
MIDRTAAAAVTEVRGGRRTLGRDRLAIEEPLEIRVRAGGAETNVSITMRTPGEDGELAVGFLFTEGLLRGGADVAGVSTPGDDVVVVELRAGVPAPEPRQTRAFTTTSACGVCGRSSLEGLRATPPGPLGPGPRLGEGLVHGLPAALRVAQATFAATGGLHAAGLFDASGTLLLAREDVGRHNAVDKVVGARLLAGALPATDTVLVVSGRASFELVQKALMAQIAVLAAVGAPSSLAVSLAAEAGMTLLGFVRDQRFNLYCGPERIAAG